MTNKKVLREVLSQAASNCIVESDDATGGKNLYMKGIFIQGDTRNQNQRVYPGREIARAVKTVNDQLAGNYTILGELDHPDDLKINLDRVSHMITEMWMNGSDGYGKLKILPTPMGELVRAMITSGVKLGVSSRGSGNVKEDGSGEVSDFEIITVDVVANPSAPAAYPVPIYEHFMNTPGGYKAVKVATEAQGDPRVQKYIKEHLLRIIGGLQ